MSEKPNPEVMCNRIIQIQINPKAKTNVKVIASNPLWLKSNQIVRRMGGFKSKFAHAHPNPHIKSKESPDCSSRYQTHRSLKYIAGNQWPGCSKTNTTVSIYQTEKKFQNETKASNSDREEIRKPVNVATQ